VDLGPPGDPTGHAVPVVVSANVVLEPIDEMGTLRPGPDQGHLAPDDVDELGQLVDAQPPEQPAHGGHALVFRFEPRGVAVVVFAHGAELHDLEEPALAADPSLTEQDGAGAGQPNRYRAQKQDRGRQHQGEGRGGEVEGPLGGPCRPIRVRSWDVNEGDAP